MLVRWGCRRGTEWQVRSGCASQATRTKAAGRPRPSAETAPAVGPCPRTSRRVGVADNPLHPLRPEVSLPSTASNSSPLIAQDDRDLTGRIEKSGGPGSIPGFGRWSSCSAADQATLCKGLVDDDQRDAKPDTRSNYLRDVLGKLVKGELVEPSSTREVGCSIKRIDGGNGGRGRRQRGEGRRGERGGD